MLSKTIEETLNQARATAQASLDSVWVLVPDRFTLQAEKILLRETSCLLNIRVITFSMLYNLISTEVQHTHPAMPTIDKNRAVLFMWRAIQSIDPLQLKWFQKSVRHYSFAEKIFNTINQITSSMQDPQALAICATADITRKKMHDIALIHARYKELTYGYTDTGSVLAYLIENLKYSKHLRDTKIFICGFEHLSPQRLAVVGELLKFANSVTVGVREYSEFQNQLAGIVLSGNQAPAVITAPSLRKDDAFENCATTSTHKNIQAEAAYLANKIRGLLNQGISPKDITVLLCDYENTAQTFAEIFNQNNVPTNLDIGQPLLQTPLARYVIDMLLFAHRPTVENFLAILKSLFSSTPKEEIFQIENDCLKMNKVPQHEKLFAHAKSVQTFTNMLKSILTENGMIDELGHDKLVKLLDTCAEIIPEKEMNAWEFSQLFSSLAHATKISTAPTYVNRILLASTTEFQPHFTPYLFIANAHDGNFPVSQNDTDILTESDIKSLGNVIEPTASRQNTRSRHHTFNIIQSAGVLHLSHTATTMQGEEAREPEFFEKINKSKECVTPHTRHYATQQVLTKLGNGMAFTDPKFYSSVLKSVEPIDIDFLDLQQNEFNLPNGQQFFLSRDLSVTALENFFMCPYKHFFTRGLKLRNRDLYKVDARVIGSILHKIAEEHTADIINKRKRDTKTLVDYVLNSDDFSYFSHNTINKPIVQALAREAYSIIAAIDTQINASDFKPKYVEKKLESSCNGAKIVGKVDRIDICDNSAMVVDYKTGGSVDFKLRDLYMGTKLQLPLYLKFLADDGYHMGGAVYYHLKGGFNKEAKLEGFGLKETDDVYAITNYGHQMLQRGIEHLKQGVIKKTPCDDKVCGYCLCSALCFHKEKPRGVDIPTTVKTLGGDE